MKQIPLTQNKFAIVDDELFATLNQFKWRAHKDGNIWYAITSTSRKIKPRIVINMHHMIFNVKDNMIDHINHNGLDNRKCNLRICTNRQNQANQLLKSKNTTGYRGVRFKKGKYIAETRIDGKKKHLGSFVSPIQAAKIYDIVLYHLHGEFACLNFPENY